MWKLFLDFVAIFKPCKLTYYIITRFSILYWYTKILVTSNTLSTFNLVKLLKQTLLFFSLLNNISYYVLSIKSMLALQITNIVVLFFVS